MKKKIFGILMCSMILCTTACGKITQSKEPTPTPIPPNEAEVKLNEIISEIKTTVNKVGANNVKEKGSGYDLTVDLTVDESVATMIGLTDITSVSIISSANVKDNAHSTVAVKIGDKDLLSVDVTIDKENVYFNIPEYSDVYAKMPISEAIEGSDIDITDLEEAFSDIPDLTEVTDLFNEFIADFSDCLKPEIGFTNNSEIGFNDYKFKGTKYTLTAKTTDVKGVFDKFSKKLSEYSFMTIVEENTDDLINEKDDSGDKIETLYLNYYVGKNNNVAWEFTDNEGHAFVYISSDAGIKVYTVDGEDVTTILYTTINKEVTGKLAQSKTKGQIVLVDFNGYGENLILNYEGNKDDFKLTYEEESSVFEVSYKKEDTRLNIEAKITSEEFIVSIKASQYDKRTTMSAELTAEDIKLATLKITGEERDYKDFSIPTDTVDTEEWSKQLDTDKFEKDLTDIFGENLFGSSFE